MRVARRAAEALSRRHSGVAPSARGRHEDGTGAVRRVGHHRSRAAGAGDRRRQAPESSAHGRQDHREHEARTFDASRPLKALAHRHGAAAGGDDHRAPARIGAGGSHRLRRSLRRNEPTVGDIDIVCTSANPADVVDVFVHLPEAEAVLAEGGTKASFWNAEGLQVDLRVVPGAMWGNLLQHFTGSREHNVQFRELAVKRGLRVSENGILDVASGENLTCEREEDVYAALDLPFIPPELRLGSGELDAARRGTLPMLVEQRDLRGDFHMHTTWSDGRDTLEEMIEACAAKGYEYHAISEHSWGRGPKYGMSPEKLREQTAIIRALGKRYGIRTLCGAEVDILPDGTLDFDDELLHELDFVVASVHSAHNIGREKMTARLIRAIEHPCVNVIGHPTGRSVSGGTAYDFDAEAVFAAAARTGTALEINGNPDRLDLPSQLARRAAELGAMLALDSDAHDTGQLDRISYAVGQARRAWLEKKHVLNTRPLEDVLAFVGRKRGLVSR